MSPCTFTLIFTHTAGITPTAFGQQARLEAAFRLLEASARSTDRVTRACDFSSPEVCRCAFARRLGVSPADIRHRFGTAPPRAGSELRRFGAQRVGRTCR